MNNRTVSQCREALRQSLIRVAKGLGDICGSLPEGEREKCASVASTLSRSVVPQLSADCPILVAVTGGGSAGKSTLFNLLAGANVSAADPRAGYTRRMVAAVHPNVASDVRKMELLFERFRANARPKALTDPSQALEPGDPVYVECPGVPEHLVFVDTPDFDTGTREGFANRDAAREILEVSDVILYVSTNATYNNKSGTDFLRSILSDIGIRKVAMLYRCWANFDDATVRDHMSVALSNLYPDGRTAAAACIGIWRIDESYEVASGKGSPSIRPLSGGAPLQSVLERLDPTKTRTDVMRGEIEDGLARAAAWTGGAETERLRYVAYRDSLEMLTSVACKECLGVAPHRDVVRLFAEEWERAQPWFVRNGHWLTRGARDAARRVVGLFRKDRAPADDAGPGYLQEFRDGFIRSAQKLRTQVEMPDVSFGFSDDRDMRRLADALGTLGERFPEEYYLSEADKNGLRAAKVARPHGIAGGASGGETLDGMADRAVEFIGDTESLRPEVRRLVGVIRDGMSAWQHVKEWTLAGLDTIAFAGGLTYVVMTGDAATGGTVMSMFGLNDLVAIPALGAFVALNSKIDSKTLEKQLEMLFTAWAKEKSEKIRPILEGGVTGASIAACDEVARRLEEAAGGLRSALDDARRQSGIVFSDGEQGGTSDE